MSTLTIGQTAAPVRRPSRPQQGSGRRNGPVLRPGRGAIAPELHRAAVVRPRGCEVSIERAPGTVSASRTVAAGRRQLRLTDRGIAVVLITGVMIAVAALTVVGGTALRVTSDSFHADGTGLAAATATHR